MNTLREKQRRPFWWRMTRFVLAFFFVVLLALAARGWYAFRDRIPGYSLALNHGGAEPGPLSAGFGRVTINPDLSHPTYLAGFDQNRVATKVHDDLLAVACIVDNGSSRLGIVAIDAIGFFHDDVVRVRQRLPQEWKLDYVTVCSTHNHSTPDLLGLWGPNFVRTGVNKHYRAQVIDGCVQALGQAVSNLQPAQVAFHHIPMVSDDLVEDTRRPKVFDPDIRVMHFVQRQSKATLGSVIGWANHPETVWSRNTEVTSDFCGYLRTTLEHGFVGTNGPPVNGVGGIHLFVNGAVGGLMSTTPGVTVRDPFLNQEFKTPSHEKARAVGRQVASMVLPRLKGTNGEFASDLPVQIQASTLEVHLENNLYLLAGFLGLIDRGYIGWRRLRTEVALISLGEASIACVPGEVYPEIVNGGIETPPGADFIVEPLEVPPLRDLMPGRFKFVFGLANDEIGYIIPKSEWDQEPPYLYDAKRSPYGEVNSVGPDAAPAIHAALGNLCQTQKMETHSQLSQRPQ